MDYLDSKTNNWYHVMHILNLKLVKNEYKFKLAAYDPSLHKLEIFENVKMEQLFFNDEPSTQFTLLGSSDNLFKRLLENKMISNKNKKDKDETGIYHYFHPWSNTIKNKVPITEKTLVYFKTDLSCPFFPEYNLRIIPL